MDHPLALLKSAERQRLRSLRLLYGQRDDGAALADVLTDVLAAGGIDAADPVAGFLPTAREPDVLPFLVARCRGGRVVVPRTLPHSGMEWVLWTPGTALVADRHGLQAPEGDPETATLRGQQAVLVPALALDPAGHRLGQGGGYYDRALDGLPRWPVGPLRIGVVHPEGMLDRPLPHAPHDEPVDIRACSEGWRPGSAATLYR